MAAHKLAAMVPVDRWVLNNVFDMQESASLDLKRGRLVTFSAGNAVAVTLTSTGTFAGLTAHDSANSATAGSELLCYQVIPNVLYEANYSGTLAQTDMGTAYDLALDGTTGLLYITTTTSNPQAIIYDYVKGPGGGVIGDTYARVYFKFDKDYCKIG